MEKEELPIAVLIAVCGLEGLVLVLETAHFSPGWKLPGGGKREHETPKQAAIRELEEETGIRLEENELTLLYDELRETYQCHRRLLFGADIGKESLVSRGLIGSGETGEITKIVPRDASLDAIGLEDHRLLLKKISENKRHPE